MIEHGAEGLIEHGAEGLIERSGSATPSSPVARTVVTAIKGHGTENDFLVIPDLDGGLDLDPEVVAAWCNRHAGVGADGVLRVVRTAAIAEFVDAAPWFMDYRNADGSLAEMCGNGVRVFARYLAESGLVDPAQPLQVATRGGVKTVAFADGGLISVDMGRPEQRVETPTVTVDVIDGPPLQVTGTAWDLPNPHIVCELDSLDTLAALELTRAPRVDPPLPQGQNVEFVVRHDTVGRSSAALLGAARPAAGPTVRMRVHERGSGETRSCGTGICAVVAAASASGGHSADEVWTVEVPGGVCTVQWTPTGSVVLTGPAVLVARIELTASPAANLLAPAASGWDDGFQDD